MPFIIKNGKYYASAGSNDAGDIIYDNSESELSSTNIQGAITEIANDVDTFENNLTNCINDLNALEKKFYTSKSNVNLNDILVPGFYGVSNSDTSVDLNFPIGTNGILLVFQYSGTVGERGRQIFFRVGTIDSNDHQWYSRQFMTSSGTLIFGAWEQIVTDKVLDSALSSYATTSALNTAVAKYLPLAGGTMTGNILWGAQDVELKHKSGNVANRTMVRGGFTYNDGASLYLNGKDRSADPGVFSLSASDGTNSKTLIGKPDGTFTWNGVKIATATDLAEYLPLSGGTLTGGQIYFNNGLGRVTADSSTMQMEHYGTAKDSNDRTVLSIHDSNALVNKLRLRTVIDGTSTYYQIYGTHSITASTSALTAGTSSLTTGCIHLTYS